MDIELTVLLVLAISLISITHIMLALSELKADISRLDTQVNAVIQSDRYLNDPIDGLALVNPYTNTIIPGKMKNTTNCKVCGNGKTITRVRVRGGDVVWIKF